MKNGKKTQPLTRAEIDAYALLCERYKDLGDRISEIKAKIKMVLGPGEALDGYAYSVAMSERPKVHGRVDYRNELVNAIGAKKVDALEAAAAAEVTEGEPRILPPRPNPSASLNALEAGLALRKAIEKALASGQPMDEIVERMGRAL